MSYLKDKPVFCVRQFSEKTHFSGDGLLPSCFYWLLEFTRSTPKPLCHNDFEAPWTHFPGTLTQKSGMWTHRPKRHKNPAIIHSTYQQVENHG